MSKIRRVLLLIIVLIAFSVVFSKVSFAGVSLSVPATVEVGKTFTVTAVMPQDCITYDGTITVTYSDNTQESASGYVMPDTSGNYTWTGNFSANFNAKVKGKTTVEASFDMCDANAVPIDGSDSKVFNIVVPLTGLTAKSSKTSYKEGESFDKGSLTVTASYSDGTSSNVSDYSYSPTGALKPSDKEITVTYSENGVTKTAKVGITVAASQQPQNTSTNTTNTYTNTTNTTNTSNTANNKVNNTNTNTNTTVVNPTFKEVNENVYAIKNCNVRSSCSTSANNKIGSLMQGELVVRTGYSTEWSRIKYNGQTAYVATNLLTTEEPEDDEDVNNVTNELDNNTVDDELLELKEEIGVLPEVGNPVAVKIFFIISAISTACISGLLYYKKNG